MEEKKEQTSQENKTEENKNLLEYGEYRIFGPDKGNIELDKIELKSVTGANRVWKIKSLDKKQIILDVIKFG